VAIERNYKHMIKHLLLAVLIIATASIKSQEKALKRFRLLDFHIGPSFSNFINTEAPHKTFLFLSSDEYYLTPNVESLHRNYSTSLTNDIRYSLSFGIGFEYALNDTWSIYASFNYEGKGINLDDSNTKHQEHWGQNYNTGDPELLFESVTFESTKVKLSNNYLTMPILMRKYLGRSKLVYLQGGIYMAYLLNSTGYIKLFDGYSSTLGEDNSLDSASGYKNYSGMHLKINDKDKVHTAKFDYGLSLGTGLSKGISEKLYLKADLLVNIGLKSVDSLFDNEYEEKEISGGLGFNNAVKSSNYYGLNSNAKNISAVLTVGIGVRL